MAELNNDTVQIDPNARYLVRTTRVETIANVKLRPRHTYELKGSRVIELQALGGAIASVVQL